VDTLLTADANMVAVPPLLTHSSLPPGLLPYSLTLDGKIKVQGAGQMKSRGNIARVSQQGK